MNKAFQRGIEDFMAYVHTNNSLATEECYQDRLKLFIRWMEARKAHRPSKLVIQQYFDDLKATGVSASTLSAYYATLRALFTWLVDRGRLRVNPVPTARIIIPRTDRPPTTEPEYVAILAQCEHDEWYWKHACVLAWNTGMRLGDCAMLRWSAVDFDNAVISLTPHKTKRYNQRLEIPITSELSLSLMEVKLRTGQGEFVFPEMQHLYRRNRHEQLGHAYQRIVERAGVEGNSFHCLRGAFVTRMLALGMPVAMLSRITGQSIGIISKHYNKISVTDVAAYMEKVGVK